MSESDTSGDYSPETRRSRQVSTRAQLSGHAAAHFSGFGHTYSTEDGATAWTSDRAAHALPSSNSMLLKQSEGKETRTKAERTQTREAIPTARFGSQGRKVTAKPQLVKNLRPHQVHKPPPAELLQHPSRTPSDKQNALHTTPRWSSDGMHPEELRKRVQRDTEKSRKIRRKIQETLQSRPALLRSLSSINPVPNQGSAPCPPPPPPPPPRPWRRAYRMCWYCRWPTYVSKGYCWNRYCWRK